MQLVHWNVRRSYKDKKAEPKWLSPPCSERTKANVRLPPREQLFRRGKAHGGVCDFPNRYFVHRKIILKFYGNLELTKRHNPVSHLILNIFLPLKDIFDQISLKKVGTFTLWNLQKYKVLLKILQVTGILLLYIEVDWSGFPIYTFSLKVHSPLLICIFITFVFSLLILTVHLFLTEYPLLDCLI